VKRPKGRGIKPQKGYALNKSSVASVTMESDCANTDEPSVTKRQDIVAGSITVLALSVSDLSVIVGGWYLDDET
jgi:hypothetical protein